METTRTHWGRDSSAALSEPTLAAALVVTVILNVINVASRYVFGDVVSFADELQIYLMVALAFTGYQVLFPRSSCLLQAFKESQQAVFCIPQGLCTLPVPTFRGV